MKYLDIITAITGALSVLITVIIFRRGRNTEISRERLEKVYFPAYKLMKDHLFKFKKSKLLDNAVSELGKIIEQHELLAGNDLIYYYDFYVTAPSKDTFDDLCNYIMDEQDRLLRKLDLPPVNPYYRINHRIYDRKGVLFFFIKFNIKYLVIPMSSGLIIIAFFTLLANKIYG